MAARIYIKSHRAVKALPATNFLYDCMPNLTHCGWQGDATKAYDFMQTVGVPDDSCTSINARLGGNTQHCDVHPTSCPGICTPATVCRGATALTAAPAHATPASSSLSTLAVPREGHHSKQF